MEQAQHPASDWSAYGLDDGGVAIELSSGSRQVGININGDGTFTFWKDGPGLKCVSGDCKPTDIQAIIDWLYEGGQS